MPVCSCLGVSGVCVCGWGLCADTLMQTLHFKEGIRDILHAASPLTLHPSQIRGLVHYTTVKDSNMKGFRESVPSQSADSMWTYWRSRSCKSAQVLLDEVNVIMKVGLVIPFSGARYWGVDHGQTMQYTRAL